jgi:hypothetical protein
MVVLLRESFLGRVKAFTQILGYFLKRTMGGIPSEG